ncbi:ubiquinol-cytochrome-c reductase cytochrome c1 [Botrytis cinerea]
MDTIMKDTNDANKQRDHHTNVFKDAAAAAKTAIVFTDIVEISSDDGSSEDSVNGDNDQENVGKQLINNAKQTDGTQTAKTGNIKPVEGIVDKRLGKSYPRVVPCRADSSVDPARPDQLHVPKPQCKDAKSGRGQIPEYPRPNVSRGFKGVVYTPRALNSKVLPKYKDSPHGYYSQRESNLPYLPFILQITILRSLQTALESMCYRFAQKWLPKIIDENIWECPENVELNLWWGVICQCQIPVEAIAQEARYSLNTLFIRVTGIRHLAVHRLTQVAISSIKSMIGDALAIAHIFRDDIFVPKFNLWQEKLDYCLEVYRKASGKPIIVRRLDAIKTLKEDNAVDQDKLQKEIFALKAELLKKEQKMEQLRKEYSAHLRSETDTIELARIGGKLNDQEIKQLGDFKCLEECFTLNFDRNAPNPEPAEDFSGELIALSRVGQIEFRNRYLPPRPSNGGGPLMNGSNKLDNNAGLMSGNIKVDTNGPMNGQSSIHNPTFSHGTGIDGLPSRPEPIARNAWVAPMNIANTPSLGQRTASGPVSTSHIGQPISATAVIVDLTEEDDDAMVE